MTQLSFNSPVTIDDHALLLVKGPDAQKFLQGQVTCDIAALAIVENRSLSTLGAHCTPKGRMLFSFRACELAADTVALSIHRPLLESALKALKKYSIFSKVALLNGEDTYVTVGVGKESPQAITHLFPDIPTTADEVCHSEAGVIIALDGDRYECWVKTDQAGTLNYAENPVSGSDIWTMLNIIQGVGEVQTETVEEFIPQMLNYQAIHQGISFTKGCYTGQEVVARMQYLGKLKRRLFRFGIEHNQTDNSRLPEPGAPLYNPTGKQSIGNVVIASDSMQQLLAVATVEAVAADQVYIDQACRHKLGLLSLPYSVDG